MYSECYTCGSHDNNDCVVLSAAAAVGKSGRTLSPVPCFDRSDSVTPTNELIDEETSLTPKSVSAL